MRRTKIIHKIGFAVNLLYTFAIKSSMILLASSKKVFCFHKRNIPAKNSSQTVIPKYTCAISKNTFPTQNAISPIVNLKNIPCIVFSWRQRRALNKISPSAVIAIKKKNKKANMMITWKICINRALPNKDHVRAVVPIIYIPVPATILKSNQDNFIAPLTKNKYHNGISEARIATITGVQFFQVQSIFNPSHWPPVHVVNALHQ